ncbi:MAG TPA: aldo/keto reductase [Planctomycetota bacterium]|nr:aldo/keto reductase [Planctomycetota bacterium]
MTLGTMRFSEKGLSVSSVRSLISYAFEAGVTTHHVSNEYPSFELYREALSTFPKSFRDNLVIIAKLPFPHFKDVDLDVSVFRQRVDRYLEWLGVDKIDVVQWLFRSEPPDDSIRIPRLSACAEDLRGCFRDLIRSRKVGNIAAFPYTCGFWRLSAKLGLVDSQVNYLNLIETEYSEFLEDCHFIAIRPLAAGKLSGRGGGIGPDLAGALKAASIEGNDFPESLMGMALNFPLWHPNVASVIVGANSCRDLGDVLSLLRPEVNIGRFNRALRLLRSRQPVHEVQRGMPANETLGSIGG